MKRLPVLVAVLVPLAVGCTTSIKVGKDPTHGTGEPQCSAVATQQRDESRSGLLLMAQSVRSASLLPCIRALPVGWTFASLDARNKGARFWLSSDRDGEKAIRISINGSCDTQGSIESATTRAGVRRYDRVQAVSSGYRADWYFTFRGGFVTYHFDLRGHTGSRCVVLT